jgi:hypothetical protein
VQIEGVCTGARITRRCRPTALTGRGLNSTLSARDVLRLSPCRREPDRSASALERAVHRASAARVLRREGGAGGFGWPRPGGIAARVRVLARAAQSAAGSAGSQEPALSAGARGVCRLRLRAGRLPCQWKACASAHV